MWLVHSAEMAAVLYATKKGLKWYTNEQVQWPRVICVKRTEHCLCAIRTHHYYYIIRRPNTVPALKGFTRWSRSRRLPTIFNLYQWARNKHFVSLKLECQSGVRIVIHNLKWLKISQAILTNPKSTISYIVTNTRIRALLCKAKEQ